MKAERLAQVLKEMTGGKAPADALSALESFVSYVHARGYGKILPRVLKSYTEQIAHDTERQTVVTVAKDRDVTEILKKNNIDTDAKVRIDETIVGGYLIETDSRLIDASHKSALLKIYQNITR